MRISLTCAAAAFVLIYLLLACSNTDVGVANVIRMKVTLPSDGIAALPAEVSALKITALTCALFAGTLANKARFRRKGIYLHALV